ncbi:apolipoprotein N-acyltransferase [Persicobacter diffluens]|uniref:Apolipoprotein N-acyltransferase n=1 Tax=Persicobacter diffluens TaxID=981 RepID=A0AAN4VTK0_9BACT|nr:apolipoprotein N-acyltransferase [Persicobacter diffluens]
MTFFEKLRANQWYPLILSLFSGFCFWAAWPNMPLTFLIFLIFVPIFVLREETVGKKIKRAGLKFFGWTYLTCFIWNASTTWWVWNATPEGAMGMLVANSFLMTLPILAWSFVRKRMPEFWSYVALMLFWLAFENIHLNWGLSWPWLNLGNAFAKRYQWVQWYEITGAAGGTIWVLIMNMLIYRILFYGGALYKGQFRHISLSYALIFGLSLPIGISYFIYNNFEEQGEEVEFIAMQPNIDPYSEKFQNSENFIPFAQQLQRFIQLSEEKITDSTRFLLWPESALDKVFSEKQFSTYAEGRTIYKFKEKYPQLNLLTGLTSYQQYGQMEEKPTETARFQPNMGYYDVYNAGLFLNEKMERQFYHKSKLVPGVETTPYPWLFDFLTQTVFNLGGTTGNFGKQQERSVFYNSDSIGIAPSICYESIYGDFMAQYIRNGAHYIAIITNDGWWRNTPGHIQHLQYASLRAIENRRSIARSANTGISAFVNQRGDILQPTDYWVQDVIRGSLKANTAFTFYTLNGDYLGRTAQWMALFFFLAAFVRGKTKGLIEEEE